MSIRITLDRSIFHGENFARLVSSPLLKHCKSKRFSIYHSSILIEETLNLLLNDDKANELPDQLKFLIDIGTGRWFRETMEIWSGELEGRTKNNYLFMSHNEQKAAVQQLLNKAYLHVKNDKEVLQEKKTIADKKDNMKKILVDMRRTVGLELKKMPGAKPSALNFRPYCDGKLDDFGAEAIRKHVKTSIDTAQVIDRWKRNKPRYPYFTLSMEAWLYATYYAMAEHNAPIDWNTQMDISLLVIAKELDVVASNDRKFMKSAFQALYGNTKEYLTLDEFLKRME